MGTPMPDSLDKAHTPAQGKAVPAIVPSPNAANTTISASQIIGKVNLGFGKNSKHQR